MTSLTQPQPPGEQARTLVAFVGEDEQLDHVRDAAVALAVRDGARLILYDRDAASAFADPRRTSGPPPASVRSTATHSPTRSW